MVIHSFLPFCWIKQLLYLFHLSDSSLSHPLSQCDLCFFSVCVEFDCLMLSCIFNFPRISANCLRWLISCISFPNFRACCFFFKAYSRLLTIFFVTCLTLPPSFIFLFCLLLGSIVSNQDCRNAGVSLPFSNS